MARAAAPQVGMLERRWEDPAAELPLALREPACYPHPVGEVELVETHISWVFLTGEIAYKVKKPVNLGFLDFSTLERRRYFCEEELRLNRRLAADLYLGVVPITGSARQPRMGGAGEPIDYAVKMRQFPQEALLDRQVVQGQVSAQLIDSLAAQVAAFHATIAVAEPASGFGKPSALLDGMAQDFSQLKALLPAGAEAQAVDALEQWSRREHAARSALFAARLRGGFVRECHGDLHLANMVLLDNRVCIFDGIDFNPRLRWLDVIDEIAFLVMDLEHRGRSDLAYRFLNAYLELSGDYEGVQVLRFYLVHRALVRAKVAAIRAHQPEAPHRAGQQARAQFKKYLRLAERYAAPQQPVLAITHGLSGSGKTTAAQTIVESAGAIRVRSDVERKRLQGLAASARSGSTLGAGLYAEVHTRATYQRLARCARAIVAGGWPVIADATFLRRSQRAKLRALADKLSVPFRIADFRADAATLRARVEQRGDRGGDASEATLAVLEHQQASQEPLDAEELQHAVVFDTSRMSIREIAAAGARLLRPRAASAATASTSTAVTARSQLP